MFLARKTEIFRANSQTNQLNKYQNIKPSRSLSSLSYCSLPISNIFNYIKKPDYKKEDGIPPFDLIRFFNLYKFRTKTITVQKVSRNFHGTTCFNKKTIVPVTTLSRTGTELLMASTRGFEPPTYRLGGGRSILLSYVDVYFRSEKAEALLLY